MLAVNVRGVFLASQAAAARMPAGGRIITIGTCMTQRVPGPGGTLYATSKSALTGLTKALARELGGRGITANIVHPGPIDTDMNPADGPYAADQAAMTALGRFGTAEEVAAMVAHLAGAEYVTGAEFAVDGGSRGVRPTGVFNPAAPARPVPTRPVPTGCRARAPSSA